MKTISNALTVASSPPDASLSVEAIPDQLLTHLLVSRSGVLLIAVANDLPTRREAAGRLLQAAEGRLTFANFHFAGDHLSLMDFLRTEASAAVVIADGLSELDDGLRRQAIVGLNQQRGVLAAWGRSLVLWVAEAHLAELMHLAGDFWAWHAGLYYFPSATEKGISADRNLPPDETVLLRQYLARSRDQFRYLPLPLARRSGPDARADTELAEVFVPLTLRDPQEAERSSQPVSKKGQRRDTVVGVEGEDAKPASFGDVFNRYPCFLLVGPPGCGKTTLLRRAGLAFADGAARTDLGWGGPDLLPVFLRLRNFGVFLAENKSRFASPTPAALTTFMDRYFRDEHRLVLPAGFFERRLAEGRCLVLLDGLDEVAGNRDDVARHVNAFIRQFASRGNRFGLASRPKGYESVEAILRPAAPAVARVNPLGPEGIRQLVGNLVRKLESNPLQRAKDSADLPRSILASPDLTLIAGTPLFCTTLMLVYKYRGARLPQRRVEVYQEIVDLLLGFWKAQERELARADELALEDGTSAALTDISEAVAVKKRRLARLALWMQARRLTDAPTEEARAVLADYLRQQERKDEATARQWAENFLLNSHERSGIFVEVEAGKHAFIHQGFREYLAATALTNEREARFVQIVLNNLTDDWWEQVILLAGAHPSLPDAARAYLVEAMLEAAADPALKPALRHARLLMAGQCAVDMAGHLPGPERDLVKETLLHLLRDTGDSQPYPNDPPKLTPPKTLPPKTRLAAGELLDALGWTPPDLFDFVRIGEQNAEGSGQKAVGSASRLLPSARFAWIAKYPVTNLQYQRFLESDDYADPDIWKAAQLFDADGNPRPLDDEDLKWIRQNANQELKPRLWDDPRFGRSRRLFPVVGVTWYEAAAYCVWLDRHWRDLPEAQSLITNNQSLLFHLPTEDEWKRAAGGEEGNRYPWQKTPAKMKEDEIAKYANTSESDLGTTPVCMYPAGGSPAKIMDMSGNVWEWQANLYTKGEIWRALRGGSWSNVVEFARVAARLNLSPFGGWNNGGFRVVAFPG